MRKVFYRNGFLGCALFFKISSFIGKLIQDRKLFFDYFEINFSNFCCHPTKYKGNCIHMAYSFINKTMASLKVIQFTVLQNALVFISLEFPWNLVDLGIGGQISK